MQLDTAVLLSRAAEDVGVECEVREEYSGRGMFGRTTAALVVESPLVLVGLAALIAGERRYPADLEDFLTNLNNLTWDSMGLSYVVY